jgi:hypothetical protein
MNRLPQDHLRAIAIFRRALARLTTLERALLLLLQRQQVLDYRQIKRS